MEKTDTEQFRRSLLTLLKSLERPLQRRDEIAVQNNADALDQVQHAADRELAIRRLEFDSSRMRSVRSAIERIDEGTYGTCLRCDEEISTKRLKAVPWTEYCLECQEIADRDRLQAAKEEAMPATAIRGEVA
jgi:DnaK suppressor protein